MSFLQRLEQGALKRYLGVQGGVMLRGERWEQLAARNPWFAKANNALTLAPTFKWGLTIVPLYSAISGDPPVEKLDVNTSAALAFTGVVWGYYSTLVRPKAVALGVVSAALVVSNGWNVVRRIRYDMEKNAAAAATSAPSKSA